MNYKEDMQDIIDSDRSWEYKFDALAQYYGFEEETLDAIYLLIKARLIDELKADVQGVYSQADLVEKE